jgi:hypothetical protein
MDMAKTTVARAAANANRYHFSSVFLMKELMAVIDPVFLRLFGSHILAFDSLTSKQSGAKLRLTP